jgi:hypothetical protein
MKKQFISLVTKQSKSAADTHCKTLMTQTAKLKNSETEQGLYNMTSYQLLLYRTVLQAQIGKLL